LFLGFIFAAIITPEIMKTITKTTATVIQLNGGNVSSGLGVTNVLELVGFGLNVGFGLAIGIGVELGFGMLPTI